MFDISGFGVAHVLEGHLTMDVKSGYECWKMAWQMVEKVENYY